MTAVSTDGGAAPAFALDDVLGVLRRRWPLMLAPLILCSLLGAAVAIILPPRYSSTATILVESQQIPEDLARSTITSTAIERVELIEQRLMTRQNLLEIATKHNVFPDMRAMSPTEIVDAMREASNIENIALATRRRDEVTASAIVISFSANAPSIAANVTNEFVSRMLEQNIRQRNERASGTLDFFTQEAERLANELARIEQRITEYKNANDSALPESLEFRRGELVDLQQRLFERESRLIQLEEDRRTIDQALASGQIGLVTGAAASPQQQELDRLRSQLIQQRSVYAENHPTIRSLAARIAALEQTVASDAGGELVGEDGADAVVPSDVLRARRQIELIDSQIALLTNQIETDRRRLDDIEASIARTPQVAMDLNGLLRQQDGLRIQYEQAVLKRADAATGERLEVTRQAERFEVIEQAQVPSEPDSPNRPLIMAGGVIVGGGLGVVLMGVVELLNRRIRTARDMIRQLDLRPVVTIPYIVLPAEARARRWKQRIVVLALIVLLPASLYVIDQFYRPLPLLLQRFLEQTGLDGVVRLLVMRLGG